MIRSIYTDRLHLDTVYVYMVDNICVVYYKLYIDILCLINTVLSGMGGIGPCTTVTINRLGVMLEEKYNTPYSSIIGRIHCHLNFALLRMRGARSSFHHPAHIDISAAALHQWRVKYEQLRERPIMSDLNLLPIYP